MYENYETFTTDCHKSLAARVQLLSEKLIEDEGYNEITMRQIILTYCYIITEGIHFTLSGCLIIPLREYLTLTDFQISMISSTIFVGIGIGSLVSASLVNCSGRSQIIKVFTIILFLLNVALAYCDSYYQFLLVRILIGFALGVITPISFNLLTEHLPIRYRAFVLTTTWTAFNLGNIITLIIILIVMPNYEVSKIKQVILLTSIFPFIPALLNLFYLKDSYRSLILKGKKQEGLKVLESMVGPLNHKDKIQIVQEIMEGVNKNVSSNLSELFNGNYLLLTVLLTCIWFQGRIVSHGSNLISGLTLREFTNGEEIPNKDIIVNLIWIGLMMFPSAAVGGVLTEISILGRKYSILLTLVISLCFLSILISYPKYFTATFGLWQFFHIIAINIITTYSCEVYSIRVRDMAIGYLFFCTRVGGVLSQTIYLILFNINYMWPYYLSFGLGTFVLILTSLLPDETCESSLDED